MALSEKTSTGRESVNTAPENTSSESEIYFAMGCFWGAERIFWRTPGVLETEVGYLGGTWDEPTYEDVCTGESGHAETVRVKYDPTVVSAPELLRVFWENHDPTTLNRQGNDEGTQYRSAIFWTTPEQESAAQETASSFQGALDAAGRGKITTQISAKQDAGKFWPAEEYHQRYLEKNPAGYCNHGFKGVTCPVGIANLPAQTSIEPPRS